MSDSSITKFDLSVLPSSILPTQIQHYILMASVSDFDVAKQNWDLLKSHLKIDSNNLAQDGTTILAQIYDKLDPGSNRLLPMLYKNLQQLDDPLLQSIKSFYRYTWAKNYYFYQQVKNIAEKCSQLNIDITLLKGLSTAFYYADDPAIRVMEDVDILVPPKQIHLLAKICQREFNAKLPYRLKKHLRFSHAALVEINENEVDVHWSLFYENISWDVYSEINCISKVSHEANIFVLAPDYAFFHAIVHGVKPNYIPTIRWISDCYLIQKNHQINWEKIVSLAIELNYIESIRVAIEVLPIYGIVIPKHIVERIRALKIDQNRVKCWLKHDDFYLEGRSASKKIIDNLELIYLEHKSYKRGMMRSIIALLYQVNRIFHLN